MTPADDLRRVRELLADPARWTTGTDARNRDGVKVMATATDAVCWCVGGAVIKTVPEQRRPPVWHLLNQAAAHYRYDNYSVFNDREGHARVLRLVEVAVTLAETADDEHVEEVA